VAEETRIVSVLFVDLVASTALSVRLGDDETDRMRRRYFGMLREAISLHRGEEVSSAGDGMLAAFEGSAVDAVGCAVAIQRGIAGLNDRHPGLELSVRVGVSVGEVASEDGEWHGMPLVEGARLESAAQPDQILVSDLVRSLVGSRGGFLFDSVGALELKGLAQPLPASRVEWEPSVSVPVVPLAVALQTADHAELIGRTDELARLGVAWDSALDGSTRCVAIQGESGIGKTRLAAAFIASLRADDVIVLYGRCDPNAADRCEPFAQALRSFVAAATPEQVRDATGPYGAALSTVVPLLRRQLPDLAEEPAASTNAEVPAAIGTFLENVSLLAPVLLVLDDLDGADDETIRVLDRVLSTATRSRLLILGLGRDQIVLPNAAADVLELGRLLHDEIDQVIGDAGDPTGEPGIVGREEPRRRIEECSAASARGRRSAILVSGEAGIGKTTLIRAALDAATDGAVVGWGTCWHGEGAPAFWPWTQALDDLARGVGTDAAVKAAGADRDALSVLIRDLGPAADSHDDPERYRMLLLDATVRWIETLAADRHVVVVLDDLQWADPSTLDLLDHLIAAPVRARLLLVGSYRHDELEGEQRSRLASIQSHTEHVHIEGMTLEEVEELIASISGPETAARLAPELHRRTGGHPLFVSELARLPDVASGGPLPTAVSEAVARRLRTLPEPTRRLLDVASVLGNRLLLDVLADVTDQRPPEAMEALDEAIEAGVVHADGADLWFAHDLFRETLYGELRHRDRIRLHGEVGAALAGRSARGAVVAAGDVARHLTLAVSHGDLDPAVRWARAAAAEERRRSAFTEAAAHLRRVRTAVADAGWTLDAETLVSVLMEEADDLARSGEPDEARELLARAAASSTTPQLSADVALAVQGLGAKFAARRDEIIAQLESALEGVAGVDAIREARLTGALARVLQHSVAEDRVRALPLSERALELGRAAGDDETLVACLLARHDSLWVPGTGAQRADLGHEIAEVAMRLGDVDRLAEGLVLEANGLLETGSPAFRPVLDRWFELMEERDEPHDRYMVMTRRAAVALIEGRRKDAETLMDDAAVLGETIHEPDTGNVYMSQRVALSQAIDDPDELRAVAQDAVAWWKGAPVLAHAVAAAAYANAGDLDEAAREVTLFEASGGLEGENSYLRSVLVGRLAEAVTILGDNELCRELFDEVDSLADSCGVNGAVVGFAGPFAYPAGILAAALGERERAEELLEKSITIARRLSADAWVRRGEEALLVLGAEGGSADAAPAEAAADVARLERTGRIWTVTHGGESGSVNHVKGITDIVELVRHPGTEIAALVLAGGQAVDTSREEVVDRQALDAYRQRLLDIEEELDEADLHGDAGRAERLTDEKEQLLEEVRRTTGLGGRIRTEAGAPAEKARKAVSARIRDAINRLEAVAPTLAAHLDRSIHTGMRCAYEPSPEESPILWQIDG